MTMPHNRLTGILLTTFDPLLTNEIVHEKISALTLDDVLHNARDIPDPCRRILVELVGKYAKHHRTGKPKQCALL